MPVNVFFVCVFLPFCPPGTYLMLSGCILTADGLSPTKDQRQLFFTAEPSEDAVRSYPSRFLTTKSFVSSPFVTLHRVLRPIFEIGLWCLVQML